MSSPGRFRQIMTVIAIAAVLNPGWSVRAESPQDRAPTARVPDVRLDAKGQFHGLLVDDTGRPLAQRTLHVSWSDSGTGVQERSQRQVVTNQAGRFVLERAAAGACRLETPAGVYVCRLWTHNAAPPSAAPSLLVVDAAQVARGQQPIREMFYSDPLLMATVLTAAIAIPIIIHKSRDDDGEGS